jgi:type III secretion apparatus needle protein
MATSATSSTTGISVNSVYEAFSTGVSGTATSLSTAICNAQANPNDPSSLINMQKELANYNMALQVQSSVMKSIEETAKSITQKL